MRTEALSPIHNADRQYDFRIEIYFEASHQTYTVQIFRASHYNIRSTSETENSTEYIYSAEEGMGFDEICEVSKERALERVLSKLLLAFVPTSNLG